MLHCNDEPCDFPPTEIHVTAAESEDGAWNIGHVFVHRPQEPIPNSLHVSAQSYSKDNPADLCSGGHSCCDLFAAAFVLRRYCNRGKVSN